jgi:hypothetical protein
MSNGLKTIEGARQYKYGCWGGNPNGTAYQEGRCMESIFRDYHSSQCHSKIWKDGRCKIHHPETIKAKDEKRQARWAEQDRVRDEARKVQEENRLKIAKYDLIVTTLSTMACFNSLGRGVTCKEGDPDMCDGCRIKLIIKGDK